MGGATCKDLNYVTGTIACKPDCTLDGKACEPFKWEWVAQGGGKGNEGMGGLLDNLGNFIGTGKYKDFDVTFGSTTLKWVAGGVHVAEPDPHVGVQSQPRGRLRGVHVGQGG